MPPYTWLFGASENNEGDEESKEEKISHEPINLQVTYNNQEWIKAPDFRYHDAVILRLSYAHSFGSDLTPEDREIAWLAEEPEEDMGDLPEEEIKKKEEEKARKAQEETEET